MYYNVNNSNSEQQIKNMATEIKSYYKSYGKSDIIICNIGTSKHVRDSLAPIVGSMLKERKIDIKVYGDLDEQITALNVHERMSYIKKHSDALIIGIDSCISDSKDVGTVMLRSKPVLAGAGVRDVSVSVGTISIVGVTANNKEEFLNKSIDLKIIYKMAENITKIILNLDNKLKRSRQRCSRKSLV